MNKSEKLDWLENAYNQYRDIKEISDWRVLEDAAIIRKHAGDIDGAIEALVKAINMTRPDPNLAERTATMLNYLGADLYLTKNALDKAETAIRESIELSRSLNPSLLAVDLLVLARILGQQGEYEEASLAAEEALSLDRQEGNSYGIARAKELIDQIKSKLR